MQAAAGALLNGRLVQLPAQFRDLLGAAGVGIGVARAHRPAARSHPDQRRGKRVKSDRSDAPGTPAAGEPADHLRNLLDDPVWINHRGAIGGRGELVRHLAPAARSRAARSVVHIAAGGGGADIDREYQRISRRP